MASDTRYIIGIDLGTTNSSVSYVDTNREKNPALAIRPFPVPQLTAHSSFEPKPSLPSFLYLLDRQLDAETLTVPWDSEASCIVGHYARAQGGRSPTRLVQSAKSWLCNASAHRRDPILPIECYRSDRRLSPVAVSAAYLQHIRSAWNHVMARQDPDADFDSQEVIVTVPASFDEVARTLTVEAAKQAGFRTLSLLEEPQAAFYSWVWRHENRWEHILKARQLVLVCDVGGGTTDFSLIRVEESAGRLGFQRHAVGRHLLLGGDNLDLAVCQLLENRLLENGQDLDTHQYMQLRYEARAAKEALLEAEGDAVYRVVIQGAGSSVVGGSRSTTVSASELRSLLADGFFGLHSWDETFSMASSAGMQVLGLPYEAEASISKHLAAFLRSACEQMGQEVHPDYVLFNGGTMVPQLFQDRVLHNLCNWTGKDVQVLETHSLDLAVAQGAAYFGRARRGLGVKIAGGLPRTYYIQLEGGEALTLLPRGTEMGSEYVSDRAFQALTNQAVRFQLLSSLVRFQDQTGDLVPVEPEEMQALPPIHTVLRYGKGSSTQTQIPVRLGIRLTEIGTVELWLSSVETAHQWTLEFQLNRAEGGEDSLQAVGAHREDETYDASYLDAAKDILRQVFQPPRDLKPSAVMGALEEALGQERTEWPPSVLRGLWDALLEHADTRAVSPVHEARWWNLCGYLLRPGYGFPADDFRVKQLWKLMLGDQKRTLHPDVAVQRWICLRRIAGGFNKGQQAQLTGQILPLFMTKKGSIDPKGSRQERYAFQEQLRCVAAMELMDLPVKERLGRALVDRILAGQGAGAEYWALGRVGARHLLHGGLANVVSRGLCEEWLRALQQLDADENLAFVYAQLARQTEQREINVSRELAEACLAGTVGVKPLTFKEQERIYGDCLPAGLQLLSD